MKAVWYDKQGPARDVLIYGEVPTPQAGPGEVRVKLEAAGINPADTQFRRGVHGPMQYPRVITSSDGAGVIDQIGDGVTRFKIGQRVWLYNGQRNGRAFGTAAEYIALDEALVQPLPDNVSFTEGATIGIPGLTAWMCLFHTGSVKGQTVLVTGGAGAVGHYAVQLAKWGGAKVIATVSSAAKAEQARAAGADFIINYKTEDVAAKVLDIESHGVDRVVEVDFGGNWPVTQKLLARHSTLVVFASGGDPQPAINFRVLTRLNLTIYGVGLATMPTALQRKGQQGMQEWLSGGRRIHNVAALFPLRQTAEAHLAVEAGTKLGTVVINCTG